MRRVQEVAVLGGGNGAFIAAADLALRGFSVRLCEVPEFEANIAGARERSGIELEVRGVPGITSGFAKLSKVTSDPKEALSGADVVLLIVPAFAQRRFTEFAGPYFEKDQVIVLMPGNFGGSFEMHQALKARGRRIDFVLAEVECMIYSGFKDSSYKAWVSGYKKGLKLAAFPGRDTVAALQQCQILYPDMVAAVSILETGLSNINTVVHAPILVLNSGWAERTSGNFLFYWDGCTPSVARVVEKVEEERQSLGRALGLDLRPSLGTLLDWYGHQGAEGQDLGQVLRTNPVYEWDTAPKTLRHRFLLEDVPYGMVPMEALGEFTCTKTPIISSIIELSCALTGTNLREDARNLRTFGLGGLSVEQIRELMAKGQQ